MTQLLYISCSKLILVFNSICIYLAGSPNKRKARHQPSKFEPAVQTFKTVLTGQHNDDMKLATSMQQQWIDLENKRLDAEKQERERERQHELEMIQIFSSMFNVNPFQVYQQQTLAQSESQCHQPTSTTPSADYFPRY